MRKVTKKLEIEYYESMGSNPGVGYAHKFKIYSISISAKNYPELTLTFMYWPSVEDVIAILSSSIYPTLGVGIDLTPWQNACIDVLKAEGLPVIDDQTMSHFAGNVCDEVLHAYIKKDQNHGKKSQKEPSETVYREDTRGTSCPTS
jgi:hypothetical protein